MIGKVGLGLEALTIGLQTLGRGQDLVEWNPARPDRQQQLQRLTLKSNRRVTGFHDGASREQQAHRVHHVLGVEVQLAAFLLLPAGGITIASPCPVVLMLYQCLAPGLFVIEEETRKTAGLVLLGNGFQHQHSAAENPAGPWPIPIESENIATVLQACSMKLIQ